MKRLRAVLDTNVVVSALLFRSGHLAWLREAWARGEVVPVVSTDTLSELVRVLAYPKFALSADERKNALAHYMENAEAVSAVSVAPRSGMPACRHPNDVMFVRLAYASRVDALVTGDADLLALARRSCIPILAPEAFKALLA
ncbi:MAG: putative toxin-antitoxin system toxin component, PIN family [Betaproteobacteria bacterium]|nr:putative toxin-antitoxin system toxin component, PIN family [Betaproteobacteria bacterium]